mgnify:CR=1 FL=1
MNFLDGKERRQRRAWRSTAAAAIAVIAAKLAAGRELTVGVRPEHLAPCKPSEANLVGSVEMVEALGADTLVHVSVAGPHGHRAAAAWSSAEIGEPIALAAARDRVYLFDAGTGARIAA